MIVNDHNCGGIPGERELYDFAGVNACPIDRAAKEFYELDQPVSRIEQRQTEVLTLASPERHGQVIANDRSTCECCSLAERRPKCAFAADTIISSLAGVKTPSSSRTNKVVTVMIFSDVWGGIARRHRGGPRGSAAVKARRSRLAEHGAQRRAHGLDGENRVADSIRRAISLLICGSSRVVLGLAALLARAR